MTLSTTDEFDRCGRPAMVFRVSYMKGLRFELRPVQQEPPPSHSVAFLYRSNGDGMVRAGVGKLKDGKWHSDKGKPLDPEGLHWVAMVDER